MYPTISDMLNDLLGIYIPLPIQTFGFLMGISFIAAYWATASELKRKEALGLLKPFTKTITLHKRKTNWDYGLSILVSGLIGFKLLDMILNYSDLLADTQGFILSARGNFLGAIAGGAWGATTIYKEDMAAKQHTPTTQTITMHPYQLMGNILLIAAVSGLIGAKLFHNLENIDDLLVDPIGALLSFSGLTFYGGLIVATIIVLRYTHKHGIPSLLMMDAAAPALMLAYGIGRIGCHLSGDGDWGIVNTLPKPDWLAFAPDWVWAYRYPHNVLGEGIPILGCEGRHCFQLAEAVFPTPFYEAIMAIALFGVLWAIRKRLNIPGLLFSVYLILNGMERFAIESIRVNSTYTIGAMQITQAQLISSALFMIGTISCIWLLRFRKPQ